MRLKVLLVATATLPDRMGGSERVIWHLAHGLAARGHEPRILVPRLGRALPASSRIDGLTIVRYEDPSHSFATLYAASVGLGCAAIRRAAREWRPDVVHAHHGISGLAARLAGARPRCYTFYGPWHLEFLHEVTNRREMSPLKRWTRPFWAPAKAALARRIEGAGLAGSDRVIVLSAYSRAQVGEIHGVPAPRTTLIPGGVDLERFSPALDRAAARVRLGLPAAGPLLFTVRRLVPRMGLERLLEAVAHLPGARLVVGGTGWLGPRLEAAAATLGLAERVRFAGFIADEDLPLYYRAADLVVLPSVALEGFGLVTLEALACGTPVVATPHGGAVDVLAPLEPAWLADDATPAAIARAAAAALAGAAADGEVGARCRAHAEAFGWDHIVDRYESLYQSLLVEAPR